MSQTESFRARREALVLRLRDKEKLTFQQIGDRFDRSACRAAQIYQAARRKIQFLPNGLSNRLHNLLAKAGITVEKHASALRVRTRQCGCAANFTRRRLWVANGCVLWLNRERTRRLWSPPT